MGACGGGSSGAAGAAAAAAAVSVAYTLPPKSTQSICFCDPSGRMDEAWHAAVQRLTHNLQLGWSLTPEQQAQLLEDMAAVAVPLRPSGGTQREDRATAAKSAARSDHLEGSRARRAAGPGLPLLAWLIRACGKCRALIAVQHSPACLLTHSALAGLADVLAFQEPTPEQLAALQVCSSWACVQSPLTLAAAGVSPHGCP